jgi:hypothetical protein
MVLQVEGEGKFGKIVTFHFWHYEIFRRQRGH